MIGKTLARVRGSENTLISTGFIFRKMLNPRGSVLRLRMYYIDDYGAIVAVGSAECGDPPGKSTSLPRGDVIARRVGELHLR